MSEEPMTPLSETELTRWWHERSRFRPPEAGGEKDYDEVAVDLAEDELLFHVGTLCVLNGQRALWWQIYHQFVERYGDQPTEDAFEFLSSMTDRVRHP